MSPLDYARRELAAGVREATGKNDGVPASRYNHGEAKPWCASFVAWCFREAGIPLPGRTYKLPSVDYMERQLADKGTRVTDPQAGDIICFRWRMGSDKGPGRHVGIVEAVSAQTITTIEGNVRNRVMRRGHKVALRAITGFYRWPKVSYEWPAGDAPL